MTFEHLQASNGAPLLPSSLCSGEGFSERLKSVCTHESAPFPHGEEKCAPSLLFSSREARSLFPGESSSSRGLPLLILVCGETGPRPPLPPRRDGPVPTLEGRNPFSIRNVERSLPLGPERLLPSSLPWSRRRPKRIKSAPLFVKD